MDVDSPPEHNNMLSPRDLIVQRLVQHRVPQEQLDQFQMGLVAFVRENKSLLPELVSSIILADTDVFTAQSSSKSESGGGSVNINMKDLFGESLLWLQWLMFDGEPQASMKNLEQMAVGKHAVCGVVWGRSDLAYHCRTCEHDPTCAICVPCFQNGNHKGHDYSINYAGGGCCDCGDVTAWKREGFCSKHKGVEQIQPLHEETASSLGPVLDALLVCWKDKVLSVENVTRRPREGDHSDVHGKVANELSSAVVEMLLVFCDCSESLLSFISRRMFDCIGLLDVLVRAERFLDRKIMKKLHELLLKLLGEPLFKYEFAKVLIRYYPVTVNETIKECTDLMLQKYPVLFTFSVQIFTVPTLTVRLVREVNLLGTLLGCLEDLFISCVGEDGHLQASKWAKLYETTIRLVNDVHYVMSHAEVPKYITLERPDISRTWIGLLGLVQGMDEQRRVTGLHTEEENESLHAPFALGHFLGNVHSLLVEGSFSVVESKERKDVFLLCSDIHGLDDSDGLRHAKVGRLSQESSACSMNSKISAKGCALKNSEAGFDSGKSLSVPSLVIWLIYECLKAIGSWLGSDTAPRSKSFPFNASSSNKCNILTPRKKCFWIRKGRNYDRVYRASLSREYMDGDQVFAPGEHHKKLGSSSLSHWMTGNPETDRREIPARNNNSTDVIGIANMYPEHACIIGVTDGNLVEADSGTEFEALGMLSLTDWPDIVYDVSSQEISFHIPLHRLLSLLLRRAMKTYYDETGMLEKANGISAVPSSGHHHYFFGQVLGGSHPNGFSAFVMEHPLQLIIFCAEVRAGMWRKNGDAAILSSECYRSVRWIEQGLESDLFLLQCCAALAPPELFVKRIQERFGLSNYTSLSLAEPNEYEPVLLQEMLTLIIQIVVERRFCGLSTVENLQRELVYKLAIGDATHSQLVKALPLDLSKSDQLKKIVDMLAEYANPSGMKQGKYSLRNAYWKELDLYHPRWNSRDLQVAEDRYLRFCNVSARNVQLPRWTKVFYPLNTISRIATSKAVLEIVRAALFYSVYTEMSSVSRAPDGVLISALHLLSLALDICDKQGHVCIDKVVANVDLSHSGDQSCAGSSCQKEDIFPVLTYAGEELVADTIDVRKHQSMLSLLVLLMRKYMKEVDDSYAEARQYNISSLIENLLKKFAQLSADCMAKLKQLAPDVVCHMPHHSPNTAVQNMVSASDAKERKAKARERQAAILEKMRAEQSKFIASLKSSANDEADSTISEQELSNPDMDHVSEESAPVCSLCRDPDSQSPLCFLTLIQKSRLTSFVERGHPLWEEVGQSDKGLHAVRKEALIDPSGGDSSSLLQSVPNAGLEFTYDMEPAEVDAFLDYFKERLPDVSNIQLPNASKCTSTNAALSLEMMEDDIYLSILRDIRDIESHSDVLYGEHEYPTSHTAKKSRNIQSAVLQEYCASLLRETPYQHQSSVDGLLHLSDVSSKSTVATVFNGFGPRDCDGIHISSCGHAVHQECHYRYLLSLKQRYIRRLGFEGGHIVDPDLGELLCPVCRRFANSILPMFPDVSNKAWRQTMSSGGSSPSRTSSLASSSFDNKNLQLPLALSILKSTDKVVGQGRFLELFSGKLSEIVEPALEPVLRKLCTLYFPHSYGSLSASGRLSNSLVLWDTLKYSLISTEIAARGRVNTCSVSSSSVLESLYKELHSSGGFILSLLVNIAERNRRRNCLQLVLRFRGIQNLARSICSGVSGKNAFSNTDKQRGTFSSSLEDADKGEASPNSQFWKHAADPILAHDPFSSLMWVLFCLPLPFISSSESFLSLVHLFYAVCVVQALITCYSKYNFDVSGFDACLLNDVCKSMGESEFVQQYFVSNYIDSSCHPKDMIRRFTFPYLRRCALLLKLLNSSASAPLHDSFHTRDRSAPHVSNDALDSTGCLTLELKGVRELEDMFQINSLELLLKDEIVHALALKWCEHFRKEFGICRYGGIFYSTPVVPFRLMQLPQLYQNLLQRYIKVPCIDCKSVPNEPALCLLCGRLCSLSRKLSRKSCSCRASRCLNHAMICGAGIGVFLLVRKTTILLQRSVRQALWPSPYLDAFGEEDHDMYRGKPLYLSEERYAALTHLVASHGLDRSSEVLRQTTISLPGFD